MLKDPDKRKKKKKASTGKVTDNANKLIKELSKPKKESSRSKSSKKTSSKPSGYKSKSGKTLSEKQLKRSLEPLREQLKVLVNQANKRANDRDIYKSNKLLLDIAMQKHNKDKLRFETNFEFGGSTIVLLIEKNRVTIDKEILDNTKQALLSQGIDPEQNIENIEDKLVNITDDELITGKCVCCGKEAKHRVYFGRQY